MGRCEHHIHLEAGWRRPRRQKKSWRAPPQTGRPEFRVSVSSCPGRSSRTRDSLKSDSSGSGLPRSTRRPTQRCWKRPVAPRRRSSKAASSRKRSSFWPFLVGYASAQAIQFTHPVGGDLLPSPPVPAVEQGSRREGAFGPLGSGASDLARASEHPGPSAGLFPLDRRPCPDPGPLSGPCSL